MRDHPGARPLAGATAGELLVICAAVAERAAPLCRVLGTPEQVAWLDAALDLVWAAAAGEPVEDACAGALDELEPDDLDEGDADDLDHLVDRATALVGVALAACLRRSPSDAEAALGVLRSLAGVLDVEVMGRRPVVVRYGEPPPSPGPLVERELRARREVAALLASPGDGAVARAREAARACAAAFTLVVERLAALHDRGPGGR